MGRQPAELTSTTVVQLRASVKYARSVVDGFAHVRDLKIVALAFSTTKTFNIGIEHFHCIFGLFLYWTIF